MKKYYLNHYKIFIKHFKTLITFLNGYTGIFYVTRKTNKLFFKSVFEVAECNVIPISANGVYQLESLDKEI